MISYGQNQTVFKEFAIPCIIIMLLSQAVYYMVVRQSTKIDCPEERPQSCGISLDNVRSRWLCVLVEAYN